ncbi:MAG: proline dehydrogenase [Verrucomicrobia bacterium]|nr:MAG: proline dehydrogenase [Verrucomicrobiota bacterium]
MISAWQTRFGEKATEIPLVIAGEEIFILGDPNRQSRALRQATPTAAEVSPSDCNPEPSGLRQGEGAEGERVGVRGSSETVRPVGQTCLDPSRPGVIVGNYPRATEDLISRALECASADPDGWCSMSPSARFEVLGNVAQEFRKARADLMGAAMANAGKTLPESDPEVSEAVDFVEFYRDTARWWQEMPELAARPKGVVVVISPWNFPISIPAGGVASALAAGNTVILKPSSDAVLVAWELCKCFWRGGVSKKVLQFVPCSGSKEGRALTAEQSRDRKGVPVSAVILTGGTETALAMLRSNPRLPLFAETGGKDATIVTALSDRDQAIKHIIHSAFSHAGQKCSATSLVLLQDEVYDDPAFRRALCEAAQSLKVGSAWDLETKMGPLIRPPTGFLETALLVLEPGEEWALMPRPLEGNPNLWTPGIKYGVQPGSFTHMTEFFGPVLAVMRFYKLSEAVALVNQTGYGLTSGLESLDEREWDYWKNHINAGNLYINRVTTGAIVLRQPFGGFGKSSFGPAMKAGGPNYVAQFMDFGEAPIPKSEIRNPKSEIRSPKSEALVAICEGLRSRAHPEAARITQAASSYERRYLEEFAKEHDHFKLVGQDNFRRYLPIHSVHIRIHPEDTPFEIFARACAAHTVGSRAVIGMAAGSAGVSSASKARLSVALLEELTQSWAGAIEFVEESDEHLAQAIREGRVDRIRYASAERVPLEILQAAAEAGIAVVNAPVSAKGRLELLWYLREQSISIDYHRYGNLGPRATEVRATVL